MSQFEMRFISFLIVCLSNSAHAGEGTLLPHVADPPFLAWEESAPQTTAEGLPYYGYAMINHRTHEIDLDTLGKLHAISEQYEFNMANYIPLQGLPENDDGRIIARRILKHTLQNVLDSYKRNDSQFVQTAARVSSGLRARAEVGGFSASVRFRPIETMAEVVFRVPGGVSSVFSYDMERKETHFEVVKSFSRREYKYMVASDETQTSQIVAVRWGF